MVPTNGRIVRNGQPIILRLPGREVKLRLFVYKVTVSSRGRPAERRIEITSTYQKGLARKRGFQDVVAGWDEEKKIYVGVDPRRLSYGGPTGNASSFFDRAGLDWRHADEISIRARYTRLLPSEVEFHAFFKPACLSEYLLNVQAIHANLYAGGGRRFARRGAPRRMYREPDRGGDVLVLVGPTSTLRQRVSRRLVEAATGGDSDFFRGRRVTPEELMAIQKECEANGQLGEKWVLDLERRSLRRAGKPRLADRVRWISQESVLAGFDILSFHPNGAAKWIEVKSTSGRGTRFLMSSNEWSTAERAASKYYLYRVTEVRSRHPRVKRYGNFASLERRGLFQRSPSGWLITLR